MFAAGVSTTGEVSGPGCDNAVYGVQGYERTVWNEKKLPNLIAIKSNQSCRKLKSCNYLVSLSFNETIG
ncbi:unnamed protein product [Allacma fusca]|uniref:Uncharacterized protein n=1 Tax=Allacma fusca TaxID=39272 RepID=A0A8J2NPD5_9HEXA|nr:unnamed protein product [Allacma fusca]